MTLAMQERSGISKQRGFWLRCFLGEGWLLVILLALSAQPANAQIVVLKPLHVSRVYGYVLSETGRPLASVQVALISGGPPSLATNTDAEGNFAFPDAKGEYLLHVKIPGSAIAARQVIVGAGIRALFHRGPLYVMINPRGACSDCTSPIFASKKEYDRALHEIARQTD